jgi:alkylation response protein AidB-like acyl-CoA dehydrogenase
VTDGESVGAFRARAREWLADNMSRRDRRAGRPPAVDDDRHARDRLLQRRLWDGGFAGVCFPAEYGGLGLSVDFQRAFTEESLGFEMPLSCNIPTLGILAATLLELGTADQKARHLPAILRGEELWVQFLSEPTGGSDLAGCITSAHRDGDGWLLNGSKIWTSGAYAADYAMCLARTNWDVPKHEGLTMFIVDVHGSGVEIRRIRRVNGSMEFCQEFFDDVRIGPDAVVGEVDGGWRVASRLLMHERTAVGGGSPYTSGRISIGEASASARDLHALARESGRSGDPNARELVAEARVLEVVGTHLAERVSTGMAAGVMIPASGSLLKLFTATGVVRRAEIGLELAGVDAVAWTAEGGAMGARIGLDSLSRQAECLGGGSNEMQMNIISERVLGMPREWAADRDVPYRDVRRNSLPERLA